MTPEERAKLLNALHGIRKVVQWKPGKDILHDYAVRGFLEEKEWLVIFGTGGVMETAFPPENIDHYLGHRGFVPLGRIEEVLKWTE